MYNIGIVGLGHVARHQVSALAESEDFHLLAGCDRDPARFSLLDSSVRTFTELDEMLALTDLDVVIVASPNRMHIDHGTRVMAAGKWLVMEKPLAETPDEFARFREAKAETKGKCTLALHAAYGVEVDWFCTGSSIGEDAGGLISFDSRFYDPYFEHGTLRDSARSLGGSWIDSGINALSVLGRMVETQDLEIVDSRMTRLEGTGCLEVQGTVDFRIKRSEGRGSIDTNWTIGRDSKSTRVRFGGDENVYLLDHSAQQVVRFRGDREDAVFSCTNGLPRLTNHYIGVFRNLACQVAQGADNFEYCEQLHSLLYQAEDWRHG